MSEIDLHTHTTCSDGTLSPRDLVSLAKSLKFKAIAVTDHDTVAGNTEAKEAGLEEDLEVIEGVELSVEYSPGTMHILGYFIDTNSLALREAIEFVQRARRERNPKITEKLRRLGFDISYEEVVKEAQGGQVGRPHFAGILAKKGYVRDKDEAFGKYLAKGALAYVDKARFYPLEAIELIHKSGGLAVLAHPAQLKLPNKEGFSDLVRELVSYGLDGIEAFSSCQKPRECRAYEEITKQFGLFVTAGSDFHGDNSPGVRLGDVGYNAGGKYSLVDLMKNALNKKRKSHD